MILHSAVGAAPVHPIRIMIADRDRMGSQLLAESLDRHSHFEVTAVGVAEDVFRLAAREPQVAVISAEFKAGTKKGLQVAHNLSTGHPGLRVVILLEVDTRESVIASFRCGATGVFCRTEPISELQHCIERVDRGEIWASRVQTQWLLEGLRNAPSCDGIDSGKLSLLSKRELEVAEHAVQGQSNKQIADELKLSEHTVKNYLFRVFEKLSVSSRFELLFLLFNERKNSAISRAAESDVAGMGPLEAHQKDAKDGFIAAQYLLGLAHLEGRGVEKSGHSAYYWLRMAEENSLELRQRTRALTEQLKAGLNTDELETLERNVATAVQHNRVLTNKQPAELLRHDADAESLPIAM